MLTPDAPVYDPQGPEGRVLDPLAYWGTLSKHRGFRQTVGVRVAVEIDPAQGPALLAQLAAWGQEPPPLHETQLKAGEACFAAFTLPLHRLAALAQMPGVRAIMPGFIGGPREVAARSAVSVPRSTLQLRATPAERAQLVHEMRRALAHGPGLNLRDMGPLPELRAPRSASGPGSAAAAKAGPGAPPVIGVIDFGCAFLHPALTHPVAVDQPPRTRVLKLWDQGRKVEAPLPDLPPPAQPAWLWRAEPTAGYGRVSDAPLLDHLAAEFFRQASPGVEATDWRLHEACYLAAGMPELLEPSSHGTAVLGVAAGAPVAASAGAAGVAADDAAQADILFVQLPQDAVEDLSGGWLTPYLLDALAWLHAEASGLDRRLIINVSLGSHAGSHDGESLVERLLDEHAKHHVLVLAAGNAAARKGHAEARLEGGTPQALDWVVPDRDPTQSYLEIWYRAAKGAAVAGPVSVTVSHAQGPVARLTGAGAVPLLVESGTLAGALVHVPPHEGQASGRIWMALAPTDARRAKALGAVVAPGGAWRITVSNPGPGALELHAWVERDEPGQTPLADRPDSVLVSSDARAWRITDRMTLTAQASAPGPLVVGGCVKVGDAMTRFRESGQAPTRGPRQTLDAWAPADERIRGLDRGLVVLGNHSGPFAATAGLPRLRGTSLSAPHVVRRLFNLMARDPSITNAAAARQALQADPGSSILRAEPPPEPTHG